MQLRRVALVCKLALCGPGLAGAQATPEGAFGNRTELYLDSDHTTIVTSATEASGRFDERWQVGAHYLVDVVSSASVDVITQATPHMDDVRHDFGASGGYRDEAGRQLLGAYTYSTERDWRSHNVNLTGGLDTLDRNLTLALNLGVQDNTITRADTFGFEEKLRTYLGTASATYLVSPRDLLHFAFSLTHHDGYQASPYRFLTVDQFGYAEAAPELRTRFALVGRYHRDLGSGLALRTHLRLYTDTYQVSSATGGVELGYERGRFDVLGIVRGYAQSGAEFYRSTYAEPQRYMTLDKELSPFWDVFGGAQLGWTWHELGLLDSLRVELRALGNYFRYLDFARLEDRFGLTGTVGASATL